MEHAKRRAAAQAAEEKAERAANRGWVGWLTGGGGGKKRVDDAAGVAGAEDADLRGELNEEERDALRELVAEQEEALSSGEALRVFLFCPLLAPCKTGTSLRQAQQTKQSPERGLVAGLGDSDFPKRPAVLQPPLRLHCTLLLKVTGCPAGWQVCLSRDEASLLLR